MGINSYRNVRRLSWMIVSLAWLLAGCTGDGSGPVQKEGTAATASAKADPSAAAAPPSAAAKPAELRTDQVLDNSKYAGQLTIRYFYLPGENLSGDSFLIQSPDGKTMLVDAGLPEAGSHVVAYLKKLGISSLDIALNTHPHIDHIGGYATIAREIGIKQFYMENLPYPQSSAYTKAIAALDAKDVPKKTLEEGDTFQLGDSVRFEVLNPVKGTLPDAVKTFSAPEINDHSMVLRMTYGERTFLFTADIYKHRETELLSSPWQSKLKADMMDIPHHGSESTSSSTGFLKAVSPQIAIMSQNVFQSPNLKERLEKLDAKVYSTGLHGNILLHSDGKTIEVVTEKDWEPPSKPRAK
ncbi:Metal-dependent hydrolase, beta-lactamase superfamily II [Paenibacillus sp. UNCCL117]|uniref:ComEC/Rec2 family competence protein n=1 Tax=unclassified Paenibacillus TaxID=185978 RepID=UPI00087FD31B|nr:MULTISPECIES: MBL fold metallo-hydrolase [unclassified Paenibacillus]SDD49534.1 Metal-dependent hydrolase, beta-lactamase superfamily II [Paenibacillus sp. cl123]SFW49945.1 Metal-dependent hydrolase, beta-lactamase superfamily II [Paenibacillus sp. UNCCL117]